MLTNPKPAFAMNGCRIESYAIVFNGQVQSLFPGDQFYPDMFCVRVFCNVLKTFLRNTI